MRDHQRITPWVIRSVMYSPGESMRQWPFSPLDEPELTTGLVFSRQPQTLAVSVHHPFSELGVIDRRAVGADLSRTHHRPRPRLLAACEFPEHDAGRSHDYHAGWGEHRSGRPVAGRIQSGRPHPLRCNRCIQPALGHHIRTDQRITRICFGSRVAYRSRKPTTSRFRESDRGSTHLSLLTAISKSRKDSGALGCIVCEMIAPCLRSPTTSPRARMSMPLSALEGLVDLEPEVIEANAASRPRIQLAASGTPVLQAKGVDPVVALGRLEAALTARPYDEIAKGPRCGKLVAMSDDGDTLVLTVTDELREALAELNAEGRRGRCGRLGHRRDQ